MNEKPKDILEDTDKEKKDDPILNETESSNQGGNSLKNPRQVICVLNESVVDKDVSDEVIEQIDGNAESTVTSYTIDLTITVLVL